MKKKSSLTARVMVGLVAGILIGLAVNRMDPGFLRDQLLVGGLFNFMGQIFLRLIMMLVPPLVAVSIANGVAGMNDIGKLGRVGARTLVYYALTTLVSCMIGLALGLFFKPGAGLDLASLQASASQVAANTSAARNVWDTLLQLVPTNPFNALSTGNMLQIIVFSLFIGVGIAVLGEKTRRLAGALNELNDVLMHLIGVVMELAPYGVFGFMARTMGSLGFNALLPLARYVGVFYLGLALWGVFVAGGLLASHGLNPFTYLRKFGKVMALSFSTASSNATLPLNMAVTTEQLGASGRIAAFTLPLGATVNMNGTALMQGVAALFVAQIYGVTLLPSQLFFVVLTATLSAVGTAGVPGAGTVMLSMVLASVGLPLEGVGLVFAVDRIIDMGRTTANITGDSICTLLICKAEGEFNKEVFLSAEKPLE
ncbi:dicarboxylate/amino acid:cation symporter [Jonquetella anthropi]|uniref:dicarboxylate/amino acid:cation symporter n=1 Tax=Jonquetella anthropi TaxID=428712 RepID=UPI0001B9142D|nr:dicarboxylate/amino acid:cation symporter [Jonquetella anthropi]EEX47627.1 transporter, dicarboxylate/amino acid:cation Na+/H+ symporter family protein [Jonquetella anthropi E3_33 E1]